MNVCVHLRDKVHGSLREDNIRGESRWERQALESCFENPEVEKVYSSGYGCPHSHAKYQGLISNGTAVDTVLILHDWNYSVINRCKWKAIIINIFAGPWPEQRPEIQKKLEE